MCDYCEKLKKIFEIERKDKEKLYTKVYRSRNNLQQIIFNIADILNIKYGNGDWSVLELTEENPIIKKLKEN